MIDIKEMEEALSESRKTGHPLLDEYVLFDGDVLSKFASDELAASELIEALEEEADTIPLGKGKVWRVADEEETNEDEKEARHEEGISVDPTDDMSEEDKKKWKEMTEKNKDKFKKKKATPSITAHDLAKIDSGRSKAASEGAYADRLNVVAKLLSLSKNEVRARIALDEVSDVLDLYGVETAEKDGQKALYINTGDTNRPTLVYSTANGRMVVASALALFRSGFQREETNIKTANRCTLPSKREGHIMDFGVDRLHGRFFQLTNPKGETVIDQDQLQHNEVAHLLKKYGSTSQALDRAINTFTLNLNLQEMGLNPEKGPDPKKIRLAELRELRKLRKEAEEVAKLSNDPTSVSDWIAWED